MVVVVGACILSGCSGWCLARSRQRDRSSLLSAWWLVSVCELVESRLSDMFSVACGFGGPFAVLSSENGKDHGTDFTIIPTSSDIAIKFAKQRCEYLLCECCVFATGLILVFSRTKTLF